MAAFFGQRSSGGKAWVASWRYWQCPGGKAQPKGLGALNKKKRYQG
jgi:hypothetical protein